MMTLCIPTGQNTTSNNGGNGSSPTPAANIIGFAVVLSFLLVALCVVILLCLKFGAVKCPWSPARSRGAQPIFPHPSTLRTETQVEAHVQAETRPQTQQLNDECVSSTNLNQIHGTTSFEEQLQHPRVLTQAQVSQITSNFVPHPINSLPNGPNLLSQKARDTAQTTSSLRPRVPPLQVIPDEPPPPYPGTGYPYRPYKSPSTFRTHATTPITTPVAYAEATTLVTPASYGAQQLQTATPDSISEQSLGSMQLQLDTSAPSYHTEV